VMGGEAVIGVPTSLAQIYDPSTRIWSAAANMHTARIGFTATVLRDGRVLVVGGVGTAMNDLTSVEIFDPRTGRWSLLPALPQSRFSQSASLLPNGRVLEVGGIVNHTIARSTLIFDPIRDDFVPGPPTRFLHALQGALSLRDGRILIAGGYGGGPEAYDPRSNSWRSAGATPARIRPTMALLPSGSVLVAGGTDRQERDLSTASVFHPETNRWTVTESLRAPRNSSIGGLLTDGRVLVAGGEQVNEHLLRTAELYNPGLRSWTPAAPMHIARSGSTSTVLRDGTLLVCGGSGFTGTLSSCESFRSSDVLVHGAGEASAGVLDRLHVERGALVADRQ
jgi:Kelch motif